MGTAADLIPPGAGLDQLRSIAAGCTACPLHKCGTQTVFGDGEPGASVMLVGEQPGDKEDLAGEPFVGPAGGLLDRALDEAGIERDQTYVTNVVKHFKWKPAGKRRLHQKPNAEEIKACRPWLDAEIDRVHPEVIVLLGATAAQALLGRTFKVTQQRGELLGDGHVDGDGDGGRPKFLATVHPSSILRAPDDDARHEQFAALVADLRVVAHALSGANA